MRNVQMIVSLSVYSFFRTLLKTAFGRLAMDVACAPHAPSTIFAAVAPRLPVVLKPVPRSTPDPKPLASAPNDSPYGLAEEPLTSLTGGLKSAGLAYCRALRQALFAPVTGVTLLAGFALTNFGDDRRIKRYAFTVGQKIGMRGGKKADRAEFLASDGGKPELEGVNGDEPVGACRGCGLASIAKTVQIGKISMKSIKLRRPEG